MIVTFPKSRDDELFYSVCARYTDRMRFPSDSSVVRDLFGDIFQHAIPDLPSSLETFTQRLMSISPLQNADKIIDSHTLFPFYAPFLTGKKRHLLRQAMKMSGEKPFKYIPKSPPSPQYLRFCPDCAKRDRRYYGETWWRRQHQLPGVLVCPIDGIPLCRSRISSKYAKKRRAFISAETILTDNAFESIEIDPAHFDRLFDLSR